ncbi:hypothetical protein OSB04_010951 [Centaurea solstitialis]|uniref:Uncharacterized protein n=1 Tax=Centaurea solstitialis TaxID=347529 RepID=A0AA38WD96_9ASTR|nr:hypothetical protein OSB04_010951 [Centaurea solstitialis]
MAAISFSTPSSYHHHHPSSSSNLRQFQPPQSILLRRPQKCVKCSITPSSPVTLGGNSHSVRISASSPQAPASRGAESDAMGLLLRERIVFLGSSQIDDLLQMLSLVSCFCSMLRILPKISGFL